MAESMAGNRRTAILHIGTMKTGTSTVQSLLQANAKSFSEQFGYVYLPYPMRTSKKIAAGLAETVGADRHVVISDEGMWHFCLSSYSDTREVKEALAGFDIKIVVYFREPQDYIESCYLQGLKSGGTHIPIADYMQDPIIKRSYSYAKTLSKFEELFGRENIVVRVYSRKQLLNGDIIDDFLQVFNSISGHSVDRNQLEIPVDANSTPNFNLLLLGWLLRTLNPEQKGKVQAALSAVYAEHGKTGTSFLSHRERVAFTRKLMPQMKAIAQDYLPDGPEYLFQGWPASVIEHEHEFGKPPLRIIVEDTIRQLKS